MDPTGCPPWIEHSNAFRVVLKVAKYTTNVESGGMVEVAEQEHELWLDRSIGYYQAQFYAAAATKIIWGPSQTLSIWVLDTDADSKWKIRWDDQWQVMMKDKWDERVAHIAVEVVAKDGYERNDSSMASKVSDTGIALRSCVTNLDAPSVGPHIEGTSDTYTSQPQHIDETVPCLVPHPAMSPSPTADGVGNDDRISALNDGLRELILRLAQLNMKELVRTSVLSKQWCGFWKRLSVLDFSEWPELESADEVQQYIAIVNDVLEQRAGAISQARIDEVNIPLSLDMDSLYGQRKLLLAMAMEAAEAWIRYAMHHQVKCFRFKLRLLPLRDNTLEMPVMDLDELLPSSPKLEFMQLWLSSVEVQLPRTAVFTSLKDLTLEFVELAVGGGHLLARLLSSVCCPSLQKLCMLCVNFELDGTKELVLDNGELLELSVEGVDGIELLELRTPKLLYLEINACYDLKSLRVSAPDLKDLELLELSVEGVDGIELLELRTPKLLYLEINACYDLKSLRVSAPDLKDLILVFNKAFVHGPLMHVWRLKIDLITHKEEDDDDDEDTNNRNICLLKRCSSSVRCLVVDLYVPSEYVQGDDLIKDKIPQLPNVTSLLISIVILRDHHSFGDGVAGLLTCFKNLEYLSIEIDDDSPDICLKKNITCNHSGHWKSRDISLAKLRKADFKGINGTSCELRFLQFVLASATHLQSVTLSFNRHIKTKVEVQDSMMDYFRHKLLEDGTWTACEVKDAHWLKSYEWTPSP